MQDMNWIAAILFFPLFPFGMIFNTVFQRVRSGLLRVVLLLTWPLPGVWILQHTASVMPGWIAYWALFSAVLYGFRAVVIKEFGMWIGFLATSSWVLIWIGFESGVGIDNIVFHIFAFSLPLSLVTILVAELEKRYESAYTGVVSGLAEAQPRLSGLFVVAMLAVIGSPLFPAFFSMLDKIKQTIVVLPVVTAGLVSVWFLWSWSGMRLLQGLLVGSAVQLPKDDIGYGVMALYITLFMILIIAGMYFSRVML